MFAQLKSHFRKDPLGSPEHAEFLNHSPCSWGWSHVPSVYITTCESCDSGGWSRRNPGRKIVQRLHIHCWGWIVDMRIQSKCWWSVNRFIASPWFCLACSKSSHSNKRCAWVSGWPQWLQLQVTSRVESHLAFVALLNPPVLFKI